MKKQNHMFSIFLGVLAGGLVLGNIFGWPIPLANNDRTALLTLGFVGMTLCSQGIGRIAEDGRWLHPISLLGMLIGAATLLLWIGRLLNYDLPYASSDSEAIFTIGVLMGGKFLLARSYALFRQFPKRRRSSL